MRKVKISALGCYVPERVLTNHDLEKMVETSDEWILTRTGIAERHIADPNVATSDLAVEAARLALDQRGIDATALNIPSLVAKVSKFGIFKHMVIPQRLFYIFFDPVPASWNFLANLQKSVITIDSIENMIPKCVDMSGTTISFIIIVTP